MGWNWQDDSAGQFEARSIVWSDQFESARDAIAPDTTRFDEVFFGVDLAVARRPETFACVGGTRLHRVLLRQGLGPAALRVWFTFDDSEVHLLYVERTSAL